MGAAGAIATAQARGCDLAGAEVSVEATAAGERRSTAYLRLVGGLLEAAGVPGGDDEEEEDEK